ncbi:MAG: glycosyltransferase family 4 protein [Prevotella sp.]|nr:glycosyltransferase family 4 protein [Prevotella sp.]
MRIVLVTPFNPKELIDYLDDANNIREIKVSISSVHAFAKGLIKMGHTVSIITACVGSTNCILTYHGMRVHVYVVQRTHSIFGVTFISGLRKIIKEHLAEFDVIHAQWTYAFAYSIIPFTKELPAFCSVRDWCPYLMTFKKTWRERLKMIVMNYFFKRVMSEKKIIKISNSSYTSKRICNYLGIEKVPLIPNPIKSELILENKKNYPKETTFISIAQSLKDPRKNIVTLLKAFEKYLNDDPYSRLILIGAGSEKDFYPFDINRNVFKNVTFLGVLSHTYVVQYMDQASILVHPAFEETFGNVLLEATARCIPSIGGYDSGAVPQVLDYGRAGCLCDVHDVNSLYQTMKMIVHNVEYRKFIIANAKEKLNKYYTDEEVCKKHVQLYLSYMSSNQS